MPLTISKSLINSKGPNEVTFGFGSPEMNREAIDFKTSTWRHARPLMTGEEVKGLRHRPSTN